MISTIDDIFRADRKWIKSLFTKISGYPYNSFLIIPTWTSSSRPSPAKEGFMGFNTTIRRFEYYTGSKWEELMADSYSCGVSDKDERGWAAHAKDAVKATHDNKDNIIDSYYLPRNEVGNERNKVPRFTNENASISKLQFPSGAQIWVE